MTYGFTIGKSTFFKDIFRLTQASYCLVKKGESIKIKKYWENKPQYSSEEKKIRYTTQIENQLINKLKKAISSQLVNGKTPVAFELSGGIDSSFMAMVASDFKLIPEPFSTFSVSVINTPYDETKYVEEVIKKINTKHKYFNVTYKHYYENMHEAIKCYEEPLCYSRAPFMYYFYTKLKNKVLFTGDGPDEFLGGYVWHGNTGEINPDNFKQLLKKCFLSDGSSKVIGKLLCSKEFYNEIDIDEYLPGGSSYVNNNLYFEQQTRMVRGLEEKSKIAALNKIELRLPYLHEPFARWLMDLPPYLKVHDNNKKIILKKAASRYFNDSFIYRHKIGFEVPFCNWITDKNKLGMLLNILSENRTKKRHWFNNKIVDSIVEDFVKSIKTKTCSERCYGDIIWRLINFELWQRIFLDS
jgi:asparagine synthase (glutamine-hydrolysing)